MSEIVKQNIRKFITTEILFSDDGNLLSYDKPLLGDVVDSMGIQMLVPYLENEYSIAIPDLELVPENFNTINDISNLVMRLQGGNG
jgi:acyl carrier protein